MNRGPEFLPDFSGRFFSTLHKHIFEMREFYFLLLVTLLGAQVKAQVCEITSNSQDFCTQCATGPNPALVDGVFNGTLVLARDVIFTVSESCLSGIRFEGNLIIKVGFKASLRFSVDPAIIEGTNVFADPSHHTQSGSIFAYGNEYRVRGNGLNYPDFDAQALTMVVLPVRMVDWVVRYDRDRVDLRWSTSGEEDHDYFLVEHSTDGRTFQPLVALMQPETSYEGLIHEYHYVHQHPGTGANYYRLVQYDTDGTATTFPVRSTQSRAGSLTGVHPNPARAGQTIGLNDGQGLHEASLYRMDGTLVATYGKADTELTEVTLPATLTGGTYVLRAGRQTHRVLVR